METQITSAHNKDRIPRYRVYSHGGVAVSYVLLDSKGVVESLVVTNSTGVAGFVQILDAASLPANATVPVVSMPIAANATVTLEVPVFCSTGAVVAISTTLAALTISTNAAMFYANTKL